MFAIFGLAGQSIYNRLDDAHTQSVLTAAATPATQNEFSSSFWTRLAGKKYIPMKQLSDAEYESILRERLLAVEAEIALVDEKIEQLKAQEVGGSKEKWDRAEKS